MKHSGSENIYDNEQLQLAWDFVNYTDRHIFLTGKAGTGKTTFLHNLNKKGIKRMIITAPTGVAAVNAGGVTLHSFFQLPLGPFFPGSHAHETSRKKMFRFSREKKEIIKSLDLLVIDEISMVRADLLDAVESVLQRHRNSSLPFGGVQLLMIGDLHQLSPVAKQDEWALLQQYYESVYFFSSHALAGTEHCTIELKHVYRQSDIEFITILNKVRENRIDSSLIKKLSQRYIKNFTPEDDQGYITLTTHNRSADIMNQKRLNSLQGKKYSFHATVSGEFPEYTFPTSACLEFKEGAQVMFLRNDTASPRRYYNGKIGKVKHITEDEITIICQDETKEIAIEPVEWENIKYTINRENKEIEEEIIGKFKQFPLKPAWAVTIHKSQGLTFEKAVIDAERSFSHGQVYVALSRCRTFEGMVLASPIPTSGIGPDSAVLNFLNKEENRNPDKNLLVKSKISYQQKSLLECFDFQLLQKRFNYFANLLRGNRNLIQVSGIPDIKDIQDSAGKNIFLVSEKFKSQLQGMFQESTEPQADRRIHERTIKASAWFQEKFSQIFGNIAEKLHVETDNKELGKRVNKNLENLKQEIRVRIAGIESCENGFTLDAYLNKVSAAKIDLSTKKPGRSEKNRPEHPSFSEADIKHPELFIQLKQWRSDRAKSEGIAPFMVMHQKVLIQIAVYLPENKKELKKIKGVGKVIIKKYGEAILDMVLDYRKKHHITRVDLPLFSDTSEGPPDVKTPEERHPVPRKKKSAPDTRQISFDMFNKGGSIEQIAKERGLVTSTIEGHLTFFIENGKLNIDKLLSREKQGEIKTQLSRIHDYSLKTIKEKLGDNYSYGDIKFIISHLKYLACRE